jgi:hypothetical protein
MKNRGLIVHECLQTDARGGAVAKRSDRPGFCHADNEIGLESAANDLRSRDPFVISAFLPGHGGFRLVHR